MLKLQYKLFICVMQSAFAQYQLACVFVFRKKMNKWQRRYAILHKLGLIFKKWYETMPI